MEKVYLDINVDDYKMLSNSETLYLYFNGEFAVLINEKQQSFHLMNNPYDHTFWGELDRLSISSTNFQEENKLQSEYDKICEFKNPIISVIAETYEMKSPNQKRKEKFQGEYGFIIETDKQKVLVFCNPNQIPLITVISHDLDEIHKELNNSNVAITRSIK
ncbi:hypothetical protein [Metabacillus litoralis]|uniref:hypothetical protein n=1 Tax=Metabacillus litoralis TaxID=152268 RepID=UPI001CFED2AC|nr:hypothetical protein [Metabacillus litoralis]